MPKRSRKKQENSEQLSANQQQQSPADESPGGKNPAAVALGRLGGKKGGPARAAKLTKEQRSESARKAAQARWKKH
jgi:hypothetical protein